MLNLQVIFKINYFGEQHYDKMISNKYLAVYLLNVMNILLIAGNLFIYCEWVDKNYQFHQLIILI